MRCLNKVSEELNGLDVKDQAKSGGPVKQVRVTGINREKQSFVIEVN